MKCAATWILLFLWLSVAAQSKKNDVSLSDRFNRGVESLYNKAEALQANAYRRVFELQERANQLQHQALQSAEQLERQAAELLERATRQAQDLQREAAAQLGELQATIEGLPIGDGSDEADEGQPIAESLPRRFRRGVEAVYQKAETLQDRAYKRVYALQERADDIQSKAMKRASQLERQAESLLEKATRQARDLQREAATQLGELQATIAGLPIGDDSGRQPVVQDASPMGQVESETIVEATVQATTQGAIEQSMEITELNEAIANASVAAPSKWANVRERTLPAVLMLGGLAAYIRFGGSMIPLIMLLQVGLFAETTVVANVSGLHKWYWFATAVAATDGQFLAWNHADAIAYGMFATGIVVWVIQQNLAGTIEAFRVNLSSLAATHLSLLILVGQSSFWIATFQQYGLQWILYPALLVMINDTMAYVFGIIMGKHPLLPVISPKKTWEGFLGATLSTVLVSRPLLKLSLSDSTADSSMMLQHALTISTFVSLVSPFGGFLASVVKRAHGKKDFATWIPGHGGVVDRLDCQVMTAPFVYFYLTNFMPTSR